MNIDNKNPYAILGILPGATARQILKAYRRLAMKYHPDRNPGDPDAEKKFIQIQGAYETLGKYGESQSARSESTTHIHSYRNAEDPFENFFMKLRSHASKKKKGT